MLRSRSGLDGESVLGGGVQVVLGAGVEVVGAAGFHLGVDVGLGHALAVEVEPGEAALDVGDVAVGWVGVEGDELVKVFERWLEVGVGCVAEGGGVVEGGPGRGVDARPGDDDGRGRGGDGGAVVATVAHHVEDEDADDDGEENVVAGTELHRAVCRG
jgi:hypothetical protein